MIDKMIELYEKRLEIMRQGKKDISSIEFCDRKDSSPEKWVACRKDGGLIWNWNEFDYRVRELTLLEKLRNKYEEVDLGTGLIADIASIRRGILIAIEIVKQHQEELNV